MLRALVLTCLLSAVALADDPRLTSAYQFMHASQLMQLGHFDDAAAAYVALVAQNPRFEFADAALNNAAVCHERRARYELSLPLYQRIVDEYAGSRLAEQAAYRVAIALERTMNFEGAIEQYQAYVERFPASRDAAHAAFNVARLHDGLLHYAQAAAAYERYASLFPAAEDAPKMQFRAAALYRITGAADAERKALATFLKRFALKADKELISQAKKRLRQL